jgi:NitT/TauT family transport system permease protein
MTDIIDSRKAANTSPAERNEFGGAKAVIPPDLNDSPLFRVFKAVRVWLVLLAAVGIWQLISVALDVPKYLLPSPAAIIDEFTSDPEQYLIALWDTTVLSLYGFGAAVVVGVTLAVFMARSALFEELIYPFLNIIRVMPTVAIAPLLVIWCGRGDLPVVICSFLIAVFPIIVEMTLGLTSVDKDLVDLMRICNATELTILRKIRIPNSMPYLFSSFRVAAPGAVVGALLGEFLGASKGLGYLITVSNGQLNTAAVFLLALLSCLLGIVMFNACVLAEHRFVKWHHAVR